VDRAIDWPVRFIGLSHRKIFHSYPEAFIIGVLSSQSFLGGFGGCLHVLLDNVDRSSKDLKLMEILPSIVKEVNRKYASE